jgi:hypothetical protein
MYLIINFYYSQTLKHRIYVSCDIDTVGILDENMTNMVSGVLFSFVSSCTM